MAPQQSWLNRVKAAIILDAPAIVGKQFGVPLLLHAGYTGTPVFQVYETADAIDADANLTAAAKTVLKNGLDQPKPPPKVMVGKVTASDYGASMTAILAATKAFYGVSLDSVTATDIAAVGAALSGKDYLFGFDSGDSLWKAGTVPTALAALISRDDVFGIYHDVATAHAAFLTLCNRMAFDLSQTSPGFACAPEHVPALATTLTDTEKAAVEGINLNAGLPFASDTDFQIFPGVTLNGTPIYERVTADWFSTRWIERIVALKVKKARNGKKLAVTGHGQSEVLGETLDQIEEAEQAGHLVRGQVNVYAVPLNDTDYNTGRMRFAGQHQIQGDTIDFDLGLNFQRTPVVEG